MNCKLKNDDDDPEIWFHDIEYLCNRMKSINPTYAKHEIEIKTFILNQLPEAYSEVVTNEVKSVSKTTLQAMKKEVIKFYKRKFKENTEKKNTEINEALTFTSKQKRKKIHRQMFLLWLHSSQEIPMLLERQDMQYL